MGRNVRKLNFLIEEGICQELERLIPTGKRSIMVNNALRKELESISRKNTIEKLVRLNPKGKRFSNHEIIDGLAKDRKGH
jgi:rRNA-processing protein FCF1